MADRFASISSLLPARPPAQPAGDAKPDDRPAEGGAGASTSGVVRAVPTRNRPARRPAEPPRPRASEEADGGTRRTAFRLDPDLHQQLSERAIREKISKGNVVLDAIESAYAAGALEHAQAEPPRTGMFMRTVDRSPAAPSVLAEIRLTAQALRAVDELVVATKQVTRTNLIATALAHYLQRSEK